jgi:hypothetical protein
MGGIGIIYIVLRGQFLNLGGIRYFGGFLSTGGAVCGVLHGQRLQPLIPSTRMSEKFQRSRSITRALKKQFSSFKLSSPTQRPEIDTRNLYDLLMILKLIIGRECYYAHDMLLVIFVECRNEVPDLNLIIEWVKTRLWLVLSPQDAEMLVKYITLFRPLPSEVISEFDAFQRANQQDPLLFSCQDVLCKEEWCKKTDDFISERKNQIYWDQAGIFERKPIGNQRISKLLRMASGFNKAKVSPEAGIAKAENSVNLRKAQQFNRHSSFPPQSGLKRHPHSPCNRSGTDPNMLASNQANTKLTWSSVRNFEDNDDLQQSNSSNSLIGLSADGDSK